MTNPSVLECDPDTKPAASQHGFILKRFVDLTNWRSCAIFDLPLQRVTHCPIDGTELDCIASLVSQSSDERIDVGHCESCGLVTYMDTPTEAAVNSYYDSVWMGQTLEEVKADARQCLSRQADSEFFAALPIDHGQPVLEMGIGFGRLVPSMQAGGFTHIEGTEHCAVRAAAVREVFGITVHTGSENLTGPYGLVSNHHVIEHVLDPDAFIKRCASLQGDGGILMVSAPDFTNEPAVAALLFWPHVHTFSHGSLSRLLAKHGYGVLSAATEGGLLHIAQKGAPLAHINPVLSQAEAINKLLLGLGLTWTESVLTWQRDFDGAVISGTQHDTRRRSGEFPRQMAIAPVRDFLTDSPIEIQFPGRVEMCFK